MGQGWEMASCSDELLEARVWQHGHMLDTLSSALTLSVESGSVVRGADASHVSRRQGEDIEGI